MKTSEANLMLSRKYWEDNDLEKTHPVEKADTGELGPLFPEGTKGT